MTNNIKYDILQLFTVFLKQTKEIEMKKGLVTPLICIYLLSAGFINWNSWLLAGFAIPAIVIFINASTEQKKDCIRLANVALGLIAMAHMAILFFVALAMFILLGNISASIDGGTGSFLPFFFQTPILWFTTTLSGIYLYYLNGSVFRHTQDLFPITKRFFLE